MGADLNLVFAEKGAAGVLRQLASLKSEAKNAGKEIAAQNAAISKSQKEIERAYQQTLSPIQKLENQAKSLAAAIKDTKLPDFDRRKAEAALDGRKHRNDLPAR